MLLISWSLKSEDRWNLLILDIWALTYSIAIGMPFDLHILNTGEQLFFFLKVYYIFKFHCVRLVWRSEYNFQSQFSPCTMRVSEIKLRL